jgi:hypothetical protein
MRRALPVLALTACVLLSGCAQGGTKNTDSTGEFAGDKKAVAATVEDLQSAAKDRKGTTICADLITAELRDKISATNCSTVVEDGIRDTDEVDFTVKTVTVTDDKAVAQVQEETGDKKYRRRTIDLEKVAGRWRISALPQ